MNRRNKTKKTNNLKNKSQTNEMFTYILGIIIIGLLLFLGVRYIMKIHNDIGKIDLLSFKTSLETTAKQYSTKYGSWTELELTVPNEVKTVCFFDISKAVTDKAMNTKLCGGSGIDEGSSELPDQTKVIELCDAWQKSASSNVMTIPFVTDSPIFIPNLKVDSKAGYLCKQVVAGKITVTVTGLGNGVKVS